MAATRKAARTPAARIIVDGVEYVLASTIAEPSEASQHYAAADLPCTATPACEKTFKTASGQAWHAANIKHAAKAK